MALWVIWKWNHSGIRQGVTRKNWVSRLFEICSLFKANLCYVVYFATDLLTPPSGQIQNPVAELAIVSCEATRWQNLPQTFKSSKKSKAAMVCNIFHWQCTVLPIHHICRGRRGHCPWSRNFHMEQFCFTQ